MTGHSASRPCGAATLPLSVLIQRVQSEYQEMPGLCLTPAQACRLWSLEPDFCRAVLDSLVEARFLIRTTSGMYRRPFSDLRH